MGQSKIRARPNKEQGGDHKGMEEKRTEETHCREGAVHGEARRVQSFGKEGNIVGKECQKAWKTKGMTIVVYDVQREKVNKNGVESRVEVASKTAPREGRGGKQPLELLSDHVPSREEKIWVGRTDGERGRMYNQRIA